MLQTDLSDLHHRIICDITPSTSYRSRSDAETFLSKNPLTMTLYPCMPSSSLARRTLQVIPPSVDAFAQVYEKLGVEYNQIISIHCSSALNGTYQNAYAASQRFLGRFDIQVIDSESVSIGLGLLVQTAMEASARRENLDTIVRLVRGKIANLYLVFFLNDLYYLERNHLVSRSQAILGNMLGVIPFLTMEEGQLGPDGESPLTYPGYRKTNRICL